MMCTCVVTMSTGLWRMCLSHVSLFLGIRDNLLEGHLILLLCDVYFYADVLTSWLLYNSGLTCS